MRKESLRETFAILCVIRIDDFKNYFVANHFAPGFAKSSVSRALTMLR